MNRSTLRSALVLTYFCLLLMTYTNGIISHHRDARFTEKFLEDDPIDDSKPRYSQHQVRFLVDLVERMLFARATSLEEYSDISTLDERFRYIVTRFIQKKLQARIEHNSRERLLANALVTKEAKSKAVVSKKASVDLPDVQRSFERLNIQQPRRGTRPATSTRSKVSIYRSGLRAV